MPPHSTKTPGLPRDLAALATDPRFALHDGRFQEVIVDTTAEVVTMVVNAGSLHVGYRRLTLTFQRAKVVPDDLQRLAEAIGAEFRANHWHQRRAVTEIQESEVDVLPDGRFALRFRLWPFYAFAIEFSRFSLAEVPRSARGSERAGRFVLSAT